ncbi:exodeoxyribonuclease III [Tamaricihabitans halophyticus]|uniref:Exodeoxyribonuclease III n=1 Tax=Tamaricihabitans halophyticus TaxID=1262583 RepID=A0A4R2QYV0_9PSEU|nr:exodeoxyribonuclease III [Tamaricihabitans halophyticus]TCP54867.1 exodeoxyribonuclease III [Tamaricihabitans halophyticus]
MRIATWNVNSVSARLPRLLAWLRAAEPDVLCLQEIKCDGEAFPSAEVGELGYEVAAYGAGRWNGVAVLSRVGLADVRQGLLDEPGFQDDGALVAATQPRALGATCAGVRVWSVYVPNGREIDHPHYAYKLRWLAALSETVTEELPGSGPLAVLGDFNIAPTDADVWDIAAYADSTHVTAAERAALDELAKTGLDEVYPRALKYDVPFTYWDYRQLAFPKNRGMRIDLVYGDPQFTSAVADSYVDREERKGKGGSDHAPVVVDLELAG